MSKKYSEKAKAFISHKMHKMKNEDKPQDQKVAIAISMARQKGLKAGRPDIHCADHEHLANSDRRGANKAAATKKWNK